MNDDCSDIRDFRVYLRYWILIEKRDSKSLVLREWWRGWEKLKCFKSFRGWDWSVGLIVRVIWVLRSVVIDWFVEE